MTSADNLRKFNTLGDKWKERFPWLGLHLRECNFAVVIQDMAMQWFGLEDS